MTRNELTNYTMTHDTGADGFTLCLDFTEHEHTPDGYAVAGTECLYCDAIITFVEGPYTDIYIGWSN